MRAAIVRDSDGLVTNVISVGDLSHPVDPGHTLIETDVAGPGWSYDGASFNPPPPPPLDELKDAKKDEFINEGVARIAAQVPDWDTLDTIKTIAGLWSAIATNASPAQLLAKDTYLYVRDTVPAKLAAITTEAELAAIDPTAADPFGDGTPWPT